jgi:cyanophycinase-like exopeptidase
LRLIPDIAIIPHFNELPAVLSQAIDRIEVKETVVGIDASTALVWGDSVWTVRGQGTVTVFQEAKKVQYNAGQHVVLAPLSS